MGPTWTKLVEYGVEHFPKATHGIIADADFAPMQDKLDKMQLVGEKSLVLVGALWSESACRTFDALNTCTLCGLRTIEMSEEWIGFTAIFQERES